MNAEQESQARAGLAGAGIIGVAQDTAVTNLVGMTEGWAPLSLPALDAAQTYVTGNPRAERP